MSKIIEDYKRRLEEKQKEEEKTSSSVNASTSGESRIISEYQARKNIGLDTLSTDLSTLGKTIQGVYQGWQTPETMANTKASVESMYNRLTAFQEYQKNYGGIPYNNLNVFKDSESKYEATGGIDFRTTFDDLGVPLSQRALYKSPADYVTKTRNMQTASLVNSYKNTLENWDDLADTYSGYKTKEEYDSAVAFEEGKATANLDEIAAEITDLEGILANAKEYDSEIKRYQNKKNTWEKRSNGLKTDGGYGKKIEEAQTKYNEYLSSVGYSSLEELEKAISEKSLYLNEATRIQEGIKLGSVGDKNSDNYDADYDKYVTIGESVPYTEVGTSVKRRRYTKGKGKRTPTYYVESDTRKAAEALDRHLRGVKASDTSIYSESAIFDLMTDKEFRDLAYYIAKDREDGGNRTEQYVESIKESLNARRGKDIAKGLEGKTFSQIAFGIEAGADQFASGLENLTSDKDYIPTSAIQFASGEVRKDLADTSIPIWYNFAEGKWEDKVFGSSVGQVAYDITNTTANMLPSILASTVTNALVPGAGAIVGAGLMGASASGNAYQEMLNLGYDKKQARVYSTLVGISEAALEYAFGGISALGGKLTGKSISKIVNGIDNGLARFAIQWGGSALSEGFEESAQEILTPLFKSIAVGYDTGENVNWSDVVYSGLLGALSGGIMEGSSLSVNQTSEYYTNKSTGSTIRSNGRVGEMLDVVQNMTPKESSAYETYTRYAKKGINADNISDAQLGNLYSTLNAETRETLSSKKSTLEQKENANEIQRRLSAIDEKKAISKETIDSIDTKIGITKEYRNAVRDLISEGLESNKDTQSYKLAKEYKEKLDNGEKLTDKEIIKLAKANEEAIHIEELNDYISTLSPEEAELFKSVYDGKTDIDAFSNAFNLVTSYSKGNFTEDYILQHKGVLSTEQVKSIYNAMVLQPRKTLERKLSSFVSNMNQKTKYESVIDDSVIDYNSSNTDGTKVNWNSLNERQRFAITFVKKFAEAMGINLKFYQSEVKGGKRKGKNGSYNPETNTIEIDVFAGIKGMRATKSNKDTIISTFSHELTHWMKAKAPLLYNKLSNQIFDVLTKNGKTEKELIDDEIAKIKRRHPEMKEVSDDYARDESIARACEDMLSMSEEGRKIFDSLTEEEKKTFVEKIKAMVKELIEWIDSLLSEYKSDREEAEFLREYKEDLLDISKTWDAMLVRSRQTNQALQGEGITGEQLSKDVSEHRHQAREYDSKGEYWQIETEKDIFKGVESVKGLQDAAYNYILRGDKGSKVVGLIDGKNLEFIRVSAQEYLYGKASKSLTKEQYKQKMRMSTSIIDLIDNAHISYDAPDHKTHKLFPNGFKNYQGRVGIDETIFRYIVRVGKAKNGMIFYDINLEVDVRVPHAKRTSLINNTSTSNDSIRNRNEKVKQNSSNREESISTGEELSSDVLKFQYDERDYPIDAEVNKTVRAAISSPSSKMHTLSNITAEQDKSINRLVTSTNNDLYKGKYEGGKHMFSDNAIRHILTEHGDFLREGLRAQLPMTPNDIARHLSAVKDNKRPSSILPSTTKRGNPSILTSYEVNGYTLYAEEITKSLGEKTPSDLIGHTMYKAPTLATAAVLTTSARTLPKRQSMVLSEYYNPNNINLSRGEFVADTSGAPVKLNYVEENNKPKADLLLGGLTALSSDASNFTNKSTSISQGYVMCKKPFYITQSNRVFSNSETNVAEKINELKKKGYDCFIFDKIVGDNYMVAVINKAQIVKDKPTVVLIKEKEQYSERDYSYEELVSKGDIHGVVIKNNQQVKLTSDGSIDVKWVVNEVKKKCKIIQTNSASPTYYIEVPDIVENVEIDGKGIKHGFIKSQTDNGKKVSDKALLNARVSLELPKILKYSIEVNRSARGDNPDVPYSHIMLGTVALEDVNKHLEYYAVRLVVEERINQDPILSEAEILGKLYAINTKKIDSSTSKAANKNSVARLSEKVYTYNIAHLLENVKTEFDDTFSDDVYNVLGVTRKENKFSKHLQFSDRDSEGNTLSKEQNSDRTYSYDELVSKPDMMVTVLDQTTPQSRKDIIDGAKKNAITVGKKNNDGSTSVYVNDIDTDIIITKDTIKHSLDRRINVNAPVVLKIGEILKNSIRINDMMPREDNIEKSYILLGAAKDSNNNYYYATFVVNSYSNTISSMDVVYSANAKKESAGINSPRLSTASTDSIISIAELLKKVNSYFPDILPEDVLRYFGHTERPKGVLGKSALYSDREESISTEELYNLMGENDKLKKQKQVLAEDVDRLRERLRLESKVTNGEFFSDSQLLALAGHLRKMGNSTIDKKRLAEMLRNVTRVIHKLDTSDITTDELFNEHLLPVAYSIVEEGNVRSIKDEYAKTILKRIRSSEIWLSESQKNELYHMYGEKWNNCILGKFKLSDNSSNDFESKWQEWSQVYPTIFDADISKADMGVRLLQIYDDLKEASEIVNEYNEQEIAMELAEEIYTQCWTFRPIKTTADRYTEKIKKLTFEHRKAMKKLKESYKDKVDEQKVADAMYYGRLIENIRTRKDKEIAEVKRLGRERIDKYKENAERKTRIQRITANVANLKRKLLKNSKDQHIPEVMKPIIVELVQALDFSSRRMLDKGIPTQKDISLYRSLERVQHMMSNATSNVEGLEQLYGHNFDDRISALVSEAFNTLRNFGDNEFILNNMSLDDLATLDETVRFINHVVNAVNQFYVTKHSQGIEDLSEKSIDEMEALGESKDIRNSKIGSIVRLLNWKNITPYYAFKRYGEGGIKIYEVLQDGWDNFAFNIKRIIDYAKQAYTDKEVEEWSKKYETFELTEPLSDAEKNNPEYKPQKVKFRMTIAQMMSLYCLNKREQARGHILGGGIRVNDFETDKIVNVMLTEKTIDQIIGKLDARQKEVADKLQDFMNTVCADWGNEVSMKRFGYEAFGEPNYFPIKSDDNNIAVNQANENQNSLFRLLNMSFAKALSYKANNRIVISNIFDVFAQHSSDMAKYNALALPVLDAFRWYNYTKKEEKGEVEGNKPHNTKGVKEAMERAFGEDAKSYFRTFLLDINGTQNVSRDTLGNSFFTNAKIASVGANLRVALLQPTSYLRANAVISPKYLTKALLHKPRISEAIKHCGIALWKSLGYYDTNVQKGVEEQIKHSQTNRDKAVEWAMKGAEIADRITWGYLWNACEFEIRDTRRDLKVGSEEFYEAISKRLREVIYATQVVDSTMTRSELMRSSDGRDKMLTAFASEPTLAYNMLYDAYMEFYLDIRRAGKKEAWKKNGKRMARIVSAYTVTNILVALVESGFDAFRDDDDEEKDLTYFMKLYFTNFASDMSITGKIPYINELHSILKGFSSSRTDTEWMESTVRVIKEVAKAVEGQGNPSKILKNSIKVFSDVTGLPFYSIYRDAMATINLFSAEDLDEMFNDFFE